MHSCHGQNQPGPWGFPFVAFLPRDACPHSWEEPGARLPGLGGMCRGSLGHLATSVLSSMGPSRLGVNFTVSVLAPRLWLHLQSL